MKKKTFICLSLLLSVFMLISCSSAPENAMKEKKLVYVEIKRKSGGDGYYTHEVLTVSTNDTTFDLTTAVTVFGVYSNGECNEITDYVVKEKTNETILGENPTALDISNYEYGTYYHVWVGDVKSVNYIKFSSAS